MHRLHMCACVYECLQNEHLVKSHADLRLFAWKGDVEKGGGGHRLVGSLLKSWHETSAPVCTLLLASGI